MSEITPKTTMGEILRQHPSAKVGLFQRYHIGGCAACGYETWETLEQVIQKHEVKDSLASVIACIQGSEDVERALWITAKEIDELCQRGETIRLLDVRKPDEFAASHLPGAELLTPELTFDILDTWPKTTRLVFYADDEQKSLDRASYFRGYGFAEARSLAGGSVS
jgi:rhodanese-related sulfurtransferase